MNASEVPQGPYGEDQTLPESIGTFWCFVDELQGYELVKAQARYADAHFKIDMEFQPGIVFRTKDVISWGARRLDIVGVVQNNEARLRPKVAFYCKEVT